MSTSAIPDFMPHLYISGTIAYTTCITAGPTQRRKEYTLGHKKAVVDDVDEWSRDDGGQAVSALCRANVVNLSATTVKLGLQHANQSRTSSITATTNTGSLSAAVFQVSTNPTVYMLQIICGRHREWMASLIV